MKFGQCLPFFLLILLLPIHPHQRSLLVCVDGASTSCSADGKCWEDNSCSTSTSGCHDNCCPSGGSYGFKSFTSNGVTTSGTGCWSGSALVDQDCSQMVEIEQEEDKTQTTCPTFDSYSSCSDAASGTGCSCIECNSENGEGSFKCTYSSSGLECEGTIEQTQESTTLQTICLVLGNTFLGVVFWLSGVWIDWRKRDAKFQNVGFCSALGKEVCRFLCGRGCRQVRKWALNFAFETFGDATGLDELMEDAEDEVDFEGSNENENEKDEEKGEESNEEEEEEGREGEEKERLPLEREFCPSLVAQSPLLNSIGCCCVSDSSFFLWQARTRLLFSLCVAASLAVTFGTEVCQSSESLTKCSTGNSSSSSSSTSSTCGNPFASGGTPDTSSLGTALGFSVLTAVLLFFPKQGARRLQQARGPLVCVGKGKGREKPEGAKPNSVEFKKWRGRCASLRDVLILLGGGASVAAAVLFGTIAEEDIPFVITIVVVAEVSSTCASFLIWGLYYFMMRTWLRRPENKRKARKLLKKIRKHGPDEFKEAAGQAENLMKIASHPPVEEREEGEGNAGFYATVEKEKEKKPAVTFQMDNTHEKPNANTKGDGGRVTFSVAADDQIWDSDSLCGSEAVEGVGPPSPPPPRFESHGASGRLQTRD